MTPSQKSPEKQAPLPFASRSGRGVRVAVIDSGVNSRHPHIGSLGGGLCFRPDGSVGEDFQDVLGHGTAVMAAIQEKAPDAQYYALKVFHSSLRTTTDCLLRAIEWAIAERMDVVNLSLGARNPAHTARFVELVGKATERGVMLVAAWEAGEQACLPGSLSGVFGVDLDWNMPRNIYRCVEIPDREIYVTSGYPRSLPGVAPEHNLNGISFAVANMTGFIARACEECGGAGGARSIAAVAGALRAGAANVPVEP